MPLELCHTRTADGLFLSGLLMTPDEGVERRLPADAFLLVHGTGGNFYASGVLETFAQQAVDAGSAVLRINTRGHDQVAFIPGENGGIIGGAAYERISDCRFDVEAWALFLEERGYSRIALVGHSMGAVKSIYSQAENPRTSICRVIAISPPRFCHQQLAGGPGGAEFLEDLQHAGRLVDEGRGCELMKSRQPLPLLLTAEGFLAKYGPHDDYDIVQHLPHVACSTLIVLGTGSVAVSSAFAGLPEELGRLCREHPQLAFETVDGADTAYSDCFNVPFELANSWMST